MFSGEARFQSIFFDNLSSDLQWAAFPKFGYFSSRATVWSLGLLYRNEPFTTEVRHDFFPASAHQKGKNLGMSAGVRVYFNSENPRFNWFGQSEFLFNFKFDEFSPGRDADDQNSVLVLTGGINYFMTPNMALELAANADLLGERKLFLTTGLRFFTEKKQRFEKKERLDRRFVQRGTWTFGMDGTLSFYSFFRDDIPTFLMPKVSVFLSERTRVFADFSFLNHHESPDITRIFAQYRPGFQWYFPVFKSSYFSPRFYAMYGSHKRDRKSSITKDHHLSAGLTLGFMRFFENASVYMGLECSRWRNFPANGKYALDGKLEISYLILPNVLFDLKSNLNFFNPIVLIDAEHYQLPAQKEVSFEFGFSFFIRKRKERDE